MKMVTSKTKKSIHDSALRLFMEKGFDDTSINQIMRDAQLAKGTFYVYYKDKATLIEEVMITENIAVLEALIQKAFDHSIQHQIPWLHAFISLLIKHHREHPQILRLISHSVHKLPTETMKQMMCDNTYRLHEFMQTFQQEGEDMHTVMNRFFLILEIAGIVSYNAIYFQHPDNMDQVQDLLFQHLCMDQNQKGCCL